MMVWKFYNKNFIAPTAIPSISVPPKSHTLLFSLVPLPVNAITTVPFALEFPFLVVDAVVAAGASKALRICAPNPAGVVAANDLFEEPICNPEGPSETAAPPVVTAGPLGDIVVPDTANPVGAAVNVSPPTAKTELGAVGKRNGCAVDSNTAVIREHRGSHSGNGGCCCNVAIGWEGCLANGGRQGSIYGQNRQRTASNRLLESHRKQSSNGLQQTHRSSSHCSKHQACQT